MARIFICYRREDTSGYAGRLRDALAAQFGAREIFRDIETIEPGADFVAAMSEAISECRVFLVLIGRRWLQSGPGGRRLDNGDDHVRREIAAALVQNVRIIPLLVDAAAMPQSSDLPEDLKGLASRNAISLDDEDWGSDVQRLVTAIRRDLEEPGRDRARAASSGAPVPVREPANPRIGRVLPNRSAVLLAAVAIVGIAAIIGSAVLNRPADVTPSEPHTSVAAVTRSNDAATTPAVAPPAAPETDVRLPGGGAAELGESVYEILDAGVRRFGNGSQLALKVRLINRGRYDALFSDGSFRLLVGEESSAPTSGLVQVVPGESSKDGEVTFALTSVPPTARLQISAGNEKGEIPLDLSGRAGLTAQEALEARRSGKTTSALPIDSRTAQLRFADLVLSLRAATLRAYANKRTLTLRVRAENGGRYPVQFGDSYFRLAVGDTVNAPVSGVSVVVEGQAHREEEIVFDLPLDATRGELRVSTGNAAAELPLEFPPR
jgi:hypothetical protein